ncbi:MAG: hypothetical protein WEA80_01990 [Gemmatimonadaceae bacterium]
MCNTQGPPNPAAAAAAFAPVAPAPEYSDIRTAAFFVIQKFDRLQNARAAANEPFTCQQECDRAKAAVDEAYTDLGLAVGLLRVESGHPTSPLNFEKGASPQ